MTLPATDGFTGTNDQALTTYSANWSLNSGNFAIYSPGGETDLTTDSAPSEEGGARWNADVFADDQYAQAIITSVGTTGVAVRLDTSGAASYYGAYPGGVGPDTYLFKMVAGTWTQLGSLRPNPGVGALFRMEVIGTNIKIFDNGSQMGDTESDAALTSGSAGVSGFDASATYRIDDWEGGDVNAEPIILRTRKLSTQQRMVG